MKVPCEAPFASCREMTTPFSTRGRQKDNILNNYVMRLRPTAAPDAVDAQTTAFALT